MKPSRTTRLLRRRGVGDEQIKHLAAAGTATNRNRMSTNRRDNEAAIIGAQLRLESSTNKCLPWIVVTARPEEANRSEAIWFRLCRPSPQGANPTLSFGAMRSIEPESRDSPVPQLRTCRSGPPDHPGMTVSGLFCGRLSPATSVNATVQPALTLSFDFSLALAPAARGRPWPR